MRSLLKALAHGLATVVVLPRIASFRFWAMVIGGDRALVGATQGLGRVPGLRGQYLRRAFLARAIARCDPSASICYGTIFSKRGAMIDENVYVGSRCHLGLVHLERDVLLADGVMIPSGGHVHGTDDPAVPIRDQEGRVQRVRVGAGTWIGSRVVVLADVGRNSVIGAGSVVAKPIPDNVVAAGVPARVIKAREPHDDAEIVALPAERAQARTS